MSKHDELFDALNEWEAPPASDTVKQRIMAAVEAEMSPAPLGQRLLDWPPLLLLWAQVRVVRREIWLASLMVMALGVWVAVSSQMNSQLALRLLAPVIAAWGMALLYNEDIDHIMQLERATYIPNSLLLLARMTLVFGFNLGLGLAASTALALTMPGIVIWDVLTLWLVPMTLLSAVAFLLSVLSRDSILGGTVSMLGWGAYHMLAIGFEVPVTDLTQPLVVIVAAAITLLALWVVERRPLQGGVG